MPDLKLGIVGLPNVGKSTLFNALTRAGAETANYPFTTVDPNVGVVELPDPRLDLLFERVRSQKKVPATVTFVDIAGLVEGASEGEGLGNRFLAHIREVHAVVHVVRCFDDPDVTHVLGGADPGRDRGIVNVELTLADLDTVERRLDPVRRAARTGERDARKEDALLARLPDALARGDAARTVEPADAEEESLLRGYGLLTAKPVLYVANVAEEGLAEAAQDPVVASLRAAVQAEEEPAEVLPLAVQMEAELLALDPAERAEYLRASGLEEPGLVRLIRAGHRRLGLISFFTWNEKEARAWTIPEGTLAVRAAGEIHSDFERGFIRAETIGWDDFVRAGSPKVARDQGLMRSEGKEYAVQDGDILRFRFNV